MRELRERIADMARRAGDLSPLREPVRAVLVAGNRERASMGVDVHGKEFDRLAPSTLKHRKGGTTPLAPRGVRSRVVTKYLVQVDAGVGRLTFIAGWPDLPWMEYHIEGRPRLPRRDPSGFRGDDLERIRGMLADHVGSR